MARASAGNFKTTRSPSSDRNQAWTNRHKTVEADSRLNDMRNEPLARTGIGIRKVNAGKILVLRKVVVRPMRHNPHNSLKPTTELVFQVFGALRCKTSFHVAHARAI